MYALSMMIILFSTIDSTYISSKIDQICYSDHQCPLYGDCCYGHQDYGKPGSLKDILSCKPYNKLFPSAMWIINKCKNPNHPLSELCTKTKSNLRNPLKSWIPVISNTGIIYENLYCAKCNKRELHLTYLQVQIDCGSLIPINNSIFNKTSIKQISQICKIFPYFDKSFQRNCTSETKNILNVSSEQEDNNKSQKRYFDNINCEIINCSEIMRNISLLKMSPYSKKFPGFSYLLNYNEWDEKDDVEEEKEFNGTIKMNNTSNANSTSVTSIREKVIYHISFVFTCLSLISLSFLIVLYLTHQVFRNFGGYLTVCLSICLWLINFISLLVTNTQIVKSASCKYLAIFHHFVALSTFVWMAVYALDLLQTFGIKSSNVRKKGLRSFCIYCITGFGVSSFVVGLSVVTENFHKDNSTLSPGYGGSHCWFTSKLGGLVWYFIPVCLLLLWNLITCGFVCYQLLKTAKECRMIKKRESNSTLWLCLRLTAIFGIGYVLQIIAIFTQLKILINIGSIVNCLQGLLLTLCFVCTKRVRSQLRNRLSTITENISRPSSSNKSTQKSEKNHQNDQKNIL